LRRTKILRRYDVKLRRDHQRRRLLYDWLQHRGATGGKC